ncbi:hypothetical protein B0H14DRAFT_2557403 [Mycena olivaceomarginata]|nr:hypothetical protein B0H14DRAFT_2557403 [Mycena olivaceomarginata]
MHTHHVLYSLELKKFKGRGQHYLVGYDLITPDIDYQSWDRTPGERQKGRAPLVHQQLFASLKHLHQGSVIQDKAICFVATVKKMKCTGKDAEGAACDGYQVLKTATKELNSGRKHYFTCSNRSNSWPNHSGFLIPYDVDEDLSIRLFRGQSIEPEKASPAEASFSHKKDNNVYVAQMERHHCEAAISIYVPLDEEAVPIAVVVPKHQRPHTHPPPPPTKVPTQVRQLYEQAVRAYGTSMATVNKVEQAPSTIQIMGKAPGLVHPSLLNVATKQGIIIALKRNEPGGDKSGWEGLFDLYKADQEKEPSERYIHSFDFLPGRKPASAVITTFEPILLEIHEAFFAATGKQLAFKAWDPEGWLVTISGDMESAPWIGMARSFIKRMDAANRPTVDEFLMKGSQESSKASRRRGSNLKDVQEFGAWVFSLNIATITAWWNHKLNHKWILPGLLECLSGLSHEDWLTTPFTSNGNETQHHWTNSQTGIGLNARECILRAAKADRAVGEQLKASLESGVMTNSRNELSHRTARNTKRHTSAIQKAQQAHAGQKKIAELRAQLAIAVAEAKTSSSGVVRVTQRSKTKSLVASVHVKGSASTRPKRHEKTAVAQDELEGIEMMTAPEVFMPGWSSGSTPSFSAVKKRKRKDSGKAAADAKPARVAVAPSKKVVTKEYTVLLEDTKAVARGQATKPDSLKVNDLADEGYMHKINTVHKTVFGGQMVLGRMQCYRRSFTLITGCPYFGLIPQAHDSAFPATSFVQLFSNDKVDPTR